MPVLDLGPVVGPKGEQGETGPQGGQGVQGDPGPAATINGVNTLTIKSGDNVTLKQEGAELEIGAVVPGKNLLINSDFRRPVNRNGKTEYTVTNSGQIIYTVDRWRVINRSTILIAADGLLFQDAGQDEWTNFNHPFHGLKNGETYTISLLYTASTKDFLLSLQYKDGYVLVNAVIPKSDKTNLVTATVTAHDVGIEPQTVSINSGGIAAVGSIKLIAAKLELGDHQTLARQNADGEWEIIDPPDYDLQYLLCSQYSPTTGEWVGLQHSNTQMLDNWYFADPINQQGLTEYFGATYGIDRWRCNNAGDAISLQDGYIKVSLVKNSAYFQPLEEHLDGTYTLSFLFGPESIGIIHIGNMVHDITGGGLFHCTFNAAITIGFYNTTENFVAYLKAAKLEPGPVQTLAHKEGDTWVLNDPPPNKALELLKCQRYYVNTEDRDFATGSEVAIYANAQFALSGTKFPVKMRAVPTITIKDTRIWNGEQNDFGNVSAFGVNAGGFTGIDSSTMKFSANHIAYYFHYTADANL